MLFPHDSRQNILPCDGEVYYFGKIFSPEESSRDFMTLRDSIAWKNDEAVIYGKRHVTPRKVAWYGDKPFAYRYSGVEKTALPWTPLLLELKAVCERRTEAAYNSCLLNLYHEGNEGMAWHSDNEKELSPGAPIASLSFGAERKFAFRHKTLGTTVSLTLENGSLLVMTGNTQKNWLHRLPPTTRLTGPRINLTFRSIGNISRQ